MRSEARRERASPMPSLLDLSVAAVTRHTPVPDLLEYIEYLPASVRLQLFQHMSNFRLREMEVAWEATAHLATPEPRDGYDPAAGDQFLFDLETQRVWEHRIKAGVLGGSPIPIQNTSAAKGRRRNYRPVFWEQQFRMLLRLRTPLDTSSTADTLKESMDLFVDAVEVLKVHGREVCEDNVELLLALRRLRRLEVHHPEQHNTCWVSMKRLMQSHPSLTELGFFHGKLSDAQLLQIRQTLTEPSAPTNVTTLEFVSVKIRPEGYRHLVALVSEMPRLEQLRLSNTVTDFDTNLLVDAALRGPKLQRLFVEHNELGDEAFAGLSKMRTPLALRHLRLSDNAVTATTLGAICSASMDGVLNLENLELANNLRIGDPGIHALTPMLASPSAGPAVLTHLDVRGCCVSAEGATNLLLALSHNKTLTHLNLAQNFLDEAFGDVLADFLAKNDTVTNLQMNDVGIGEDGVTPRLLEALQGNTTLTSVSLGANRMRNNAACAVLRALMKRAQLKTFELVDLSGNLLTLTGLAAIARILEVPGDADEQNETHGDHGNNGSRGWQVDGEPIERKRQRTGSLSNPQSGRASSKASTKPIDELCLLNNDFLGDDEYCGDSDPLIEAIQQRVGRLVSNEWAPQRQVYDDEI